MVPPLVAPALLAAVLPASAGGDVRVAAYELDVRFDPANAAIERATAVVYVDPDEVSGDELVFWLHGELRVDDVSIGGRSVPFESECVLHDADYSLVALETRVPLAGHDVGEGLVIGYSGPMHASRARSASDYMRIDADGVYLRAFGYSPWFPVFLSSGADSHVVSFLEVRLETPLELFPVFVGDLVEASVADGRRATVWEGECDLFDAQCTARGFEPEESDGLHVYGLADEGSRAARAEVLAFVRRADALCGELYGERGRSRQLHVLQMPRYGDIASGNVIGISDANWHAFARQADARETLAHELVHAYVSVPVPTGDPLYAFLVEGLPSYFHWPVLDALVGEGFLEETVARTERDYLARRASGAGVPEVPLTAIGARDVGLYKDRFVLNDRAPLFCDWLRRRMGDDAFVSFARRLFASERVDRSVFEALVETHLPGSAEDVRLWLDTVELPERFRVAP